MNFTFKVPLQNPTEDVTHIEVASFYQRAGMNIWNGRDEPGGFFLSVRPVKVKDGCESWVLGSGAKTLVEPAGRLSRKKEMAIRDFAQAQVNAQSGPLWEFVQRFTASRGLTLATADLASV